MSSLISKPKSNTRLRPYGSDAQKWKAVLNHDSKADGHFYYSVKTTGVYCRPSCPSRKLRRENVTFHLSCEAADRAGFRVCKRCRPKGPALTSRYATLVTRACRIIETEEASPTLKILARSLGMSPFHFHRVFTKMTGLSPKAYAAAHRAKKIRRELPQSGSVTEAIYAAGYNSNGRFYAESSQLLGMPPRAFRQKGSGVTIRFAIGECSLGSILVASSDRGVCAIFLGSNPDDLARNLQDRFPQAILIGGDHDFEQKVAKIVGLVENPHFGTHLPLDIRGTAFQQRVWRALAEIPIGKTASYAGIAQQIGMPKAVRAVARACGANPLAVAIPCHRVVRTDGGISGYRWGVERKQALLEREKLSANSIQGLH